MSEACASDNSGQASGQKSISYFFEVGSPWTYLSTHLLIRIATRTHTKVRYLPIQTQHFVPQWTLADPQKQSQMHRRMRAYKDRDLKRWSTKMELPMNLTPKYSGARTDLASRLIVAAEKANVACGPICLAIGKALWCEEQDISDEATLRSLLHSLRVDDEALLQRASSTQSHIQLKRNTDVAAAAGVFDVPSYVYQGEVFWSHDRLQFLEEAITATPSCTSH